MIRMLQLLAISVEATASDDSRYNWYTSLKGLNRLIQTGYFYKTIAGIENIDTGIPNYIKGEFEPAFSHCGNKFDPIPLDPKSKYIESLLVGKITSEKLKELAKEVPESERTDDNWYWRVIKEVIFYQEILEVLLTTQAIPGVRIDDKNIGISLNGMISWLLYSIRIFIGEEEFNRSGEVANIKDKFIEIRDNLNTLLEDYETNLVDECKLDSTINLIDSLFILLDSILNSINIKNNDINIDSNDIHIQEKRYQNLVNITGILQFILLNMTSYISVPADIKKWYKSPKVFRILSNYSSMIYSLFVFSISMDKVKEMAGKINSNSTQLFSLAELGNFDVFNSCGMNREDYRKILADLLLSTSKSPVKLVTGN